MRAMDTATGAVQRHRAIDEGRASEHAATGSAYAVIEYLRMADTVTGTIVHDGDVGQRRHIAIGEDSTAQTAFAETNIAGAVMFEGDVGNNRLSFVVEAATFTAEISLTAAASTVPAEDYIG